MQLPESTLLSNRYLIQGTLGRVGPLDTSYTAWDQQENKKVVLREYFPQAIASRSPGTFGLHILDKKLYKEGFALYRDEAERSLKMDAAQAVPLLQIFDENNTTYRIHDFVEGISLNDFLMRKSLSEKEAIDRLTPLMKMLISAHSKGLFHGLLSPSSFIIEDDVFLLRDFQMARVKLAQRTGNIKETRVLGFSTPALRAMDAQSEAAIDVYGCAALLFYMIERSSLPAVIKTSQIPLLWDALENAQHISADLKDVLRSALGISNNARMESLAVFRELLIQHADQLREQPQGGSYFSFLRQGKDELQQQVTRLSEVKWEASNLRTSNAAFEAASPTEPANAYAPEVIRTSLPVEEAVTVPSNTHRTVPQELVQDHTAPDQSQQGKRSKNAILYIPIALVVLIGLGYVLSTVFSSKDSLPVAASSGIASAIDASSMQGTEANGIEVSDPAIDDTVLDDGEIDNTVLDDPRVNDPAMRDIGVHEVEEVDSEARALAAPASESKAPIDHALEERDDEKVEMYDESSSGSTTLAEKDTGRSIDQPPGQATISSHRERVPAQSGKVEAGGSEDAVTYESIEKAVAAFSRASKKSISIEPQKLEVISKSVVENEGQYWYFRTLGDALLKQGFGEEARKSYYEALKYRPNDSYVVDQIMHSDE